MDARYLDTLELLSAGLTRSETVLSEPESVWGRGGSLGPHLSKQSGEQRESDREHYHNCGEQSPVAAI